jgi:hypothetical protein
MGLFHDTIRDAHRPLTGAWIRRMPEQRELQPPSEPAAGEAEYGQLEEPDEPETPESGMQTVFRFQKEGAPAPMQGSPQAPSRPTTGERRLPAGDPLAAGAEVERPEPPAPGVHESGIFSVIEERGGHLETGHEERISPNGAAAVVANSESRVSARLSPSVSPEAVSYRHRSESNVPSGSEPIAGQGEESFESRDSGRGAPSETSPAASEPPGQGGAIAHRPISGSATRSVPIDSLDGEGAGETGRYRPQQAEGAAAVPPLAPGPDGRAIPRPQAQPGLSSSDPWAEAGAPMADVRGYGAPPVSNPSSEPPSLRIGRIDVIVVAPRETGKAAKADPGSRSTGFLSRNYLKRL